MKKFKVFLDVTNTYSMIVDAHNKENAHERAIDDFELELCDFEEEKKVEVTDVQRIE